MGWIVDRIVNVDAPATTLSEQVSVEMLEARRAERNYLLLRDPVYVEATRAPSAKARERFIQIQNLAPSEQENAQNALDELQLYQQHFGAAVSMLVAPGQAPTDRIQGVVCAYEKDLRQHLVVEFYCGRGVCREFLENQGCIAESVQGPVGRRYHSSYFCGRRRRCAAIHWRRFC